ncbi:MAG: radical SAM protein [Treponema sp.]|nr:radical SAM protein [Treponema sp.]
MKTGSVEDHRGREKGALIYPVYSRRSGGLSVGINLFPDKKICNFSCPYCEVFPFAEKAAFCTEQAVADLRSAVMSALNEKFPIRDLCFSGNGEPTLSPDFPRMLEKTIKIRDELVPQVPVVLITNGTGLLRSETFDLLKAGAKQGLRIWMKVDAGTREWLSIINRPHDADFAVLTAAIKRFSQQAPFTVQTMICKVDGALPPAREEEAWIKFVTELAVPGNLELVQIYGKARPSPMDPAAQEAEPEQLEKRAAVLREALEKNGCTVPVAVFI